MEMKDRILEIIKKEGLTPSQFAENINIQRSALSHILNDRNKPSLDVVTKIHKTYDYLNLEWLLSGVGEMIKKERVNEEYQTSLFDETALNTGDVTSVSENRKEITSNQPLYTPKEIVKEEVKYIERPARKITEIRIFFDDNTYEIFKGEK
ncbi:MAG: helix-turn-helix transcriptional regulator [Bacteroides sp.]